MNTELWYSEFYTPDVKFSFRVKEVLLRKKSPYQLIEVIDTYTFGKILLLDGKVMLSEFDEYIYHEMLVHPAMLLHPSPKKVLIIGGGDGGAVRELVKYSEIEKIVVVDIDREVVEASLKYFPHLASGFKDERVEIRNEDGSKFVKETSERFDIVFIDSTDPVGPGPIGPAEVLITEEFMQDVKKCMATPGIYVAQTESPAYQINFIKSYRRKLKKIFSKVKTYFINVPSFSGLWSLTYASDTISPFEELKRSLPKELKYYTPVVHKTSFELGEHFVSTRE